MSAKGKNTRLVLDDHHIAIIHSDGRLAIGRIEGKHVETALVLGIRAANLLADAIQKDRKAHDGCDIGKCQNCQYTALCDLQSGEAELRGYL